MDLRQLPIVRIKTTMLPFRKTPMETEVQLKMSKSSTKIRIEEASNAPLVSKRSLRHQTVGLAAMLRDPVAKLKMKVEIIGMQGKMQLVQGV